MATRATESHLRCDRGMTIETRYIPSTSSRNMNGRTGTRNRAAGIQSPKVRQITANCAAIAKNKAL